MPRRVKILTAHLHLGRVDHGNCAIIHTLQCALDRIVKPRHGHCIAGPSPQKTQPFGQIRRLHKRRRRVETADRNIPAKAKRLNRVGHNRDSASVIIGQVFGARKRHFGPKIDGDFGNLCVVCGHNDAVKQSAIAGSGDGPSDHRNAVKRADILTRDPF